MSSTEYRNKNLRRKRKSGSDRTRRERVQRRRLLALGMPETEVGKLDTKEIRTLLRHPKKVEAAYAS
jgi:hypothetical protein